MEISNCFHMHCPSRSSSFTCSNTRGKTIFCVCQINLSKVKCKNLLCTFFFSLKRISTELRFSTFQLLFFFFSLLLQIFFLYISPFRLCAKYIFACFLSLSLSLSISLSLSLSLYLSSLKNPLFFYLFHFDVSPLWFWLIYNCWVFSLRISLFFGKNTANNLLKNIFHTHTHTPSYRGW